VDSVGEATGRVAGQPPVTGSSARVSRAPLAAPRRNFSGPVQARPSSSRDWGGPAGATSLRRLGELGGNGPRRASRGWRPRLPRFRLRRLIWVALAAAVAGLAWVGLRLVSAGPSVTGLTDGEVVSPTALAQRDITVTTEGDVDSIEVRLNGRPLPTVVNDGSMLHVRLPTLVDGTYELAITSDRRPLGRVTTTRGFTVDGTPPALRFAAPTEPVPIDEPLTLVGTAAGAAEVASPGAEVTVAGSEVSLVFPYPPAAPVEIAATDEAGNRAVMAVVVPVAYPETKGVHVTANAWADPVRKAEILRMITEKRINTVELDLKDEDGIVGYASDVKLARDIGAVQASYDLKAALDELHGLGVRVIGRIVAFRDPILANAAWAAGNADWVLQTPDGQPLSAYGGFTNYVKPEVRAYNLAIAEEAARAGVDDILWDYVRRPEGDPATMVVPGLTGLSSEVIGQFLKEGHALLRPYGVYQGASVFGISATRPQTIAQDVPLIAQHVDYVAPMVYPDLWGLGEYNLPNPEAQPYDIVSRSLVDFQSAVEPTGRAVVPWLQDYTRHIPYGPAEVQAQMQAAADRGIHSWLFWDPDTEYSIDGYPLPS